MLSIINDDMEMSSRSVLPYDVVLHYGRLPIGHTHASIDAEYHRLHELMTHLHRGGQLLPLERTFYHTAHEGTLPEVIYIKVDGGSGHANRRMIAYFLPEQ